MMRERERAGESGRSGVGCGTPECGCPNSVSPLLSLTSAASRAASRASVAAAAMASASALIWEGEGEGEGEGREKRCASALSVRAAAPDPLSPSIIQETFSALAISFSSSRATSSLTSSAPIWRRSMAARPSWTVGSPPTGSSSSDPGGEEGARAAEGAGRRRGARAGGGGGCAPRRARGWGRLLARPGRSRKSMMAHRGRVGGGGGGGGGGGIGGCLRLSSPPWVIFCLSRQTGAGQPSRHTLTPANPPRTWLSIGATTAWGEWPMRRAPPGRGARVWRERGQKEESTPPPPACRF